MRAVWFVAILNLLQGCTEYVRRVRIRETNCASWECPPPSQPLLLSLSKDEDVCVCVPRQEKELSERK